MLGLIEGYGYLLFDNVILIGDLIMFFLEEYMLLIVRVVECLLD